MPADFIQGFQILSGANVAENQAYIDTFASSHSVDASLSYTPISDIVALGALSEFEHALTRMNALTPVPTLYHMDITAGTLPSPADEYILDGAIDDALADIGDWIVNTYNKPVLLDFIQEFVNGASRDRWGLPGDTVAQIGAKHAAAWRRVHQTVMATPGISAANVRWLWRANASQFSPIMPVVDKLTAYWPGAAYVDYVGFSWYATGAVDYQDANSHKAFADAMGKPIYVGEWGPALGQYIPDGILTASPDPAVSFFPPVMSWLRANAAGASYSTPKFKTERELRLIIPGSIDEKNAYISAISAFPAAPAFPANRWAVESEEEMGDILPVRRYPRSRPGSRRIVSAFAPAAARIA